MENCGILPAEPPFEAQYSCNEQVDCYDVSVCMTAWECDGWCSEPGVWGGAYGAYRYCEY
jgi:hypothetical protein